MDQAKQTATEGVIQFTGVREGVVAAYLLERRSSWPSFEIKSDALDRPTSSFAAESHWLKP